MAIIGNIPYFQTNLTGEVGFSCFSWRSQMKHLGKIRERHGKIILSMFDKKWTLQRSGKLWSEGLRKESSNAHGPAFYRKLRMDRKLSTSIIPYLSYHIIPYYTIFMQFSYQIIPCVYHIWGILHIHKSQRTPAPGRSFWGMRHGGSPRIAVSGVFWGTSKAAIMVLVMANNG